jgi:integrase
MKIDDYPPTLIVTGKTGPRTVPVTKDMVKLLRAWMRAQEPAQAGR